MDKSEVISERREFMLTTKDNPYNPYTQHDFWQAFDHQKGYYSEEYLARIAVPSFDLTDEENEYIIDRAIEEIIRIDEEYIGLGYTKAYKPDDFDESTES